MKNLHSYYWSCRNFLIFKENNFSLDTVIVLKSIIIHYGDIENRQRQIYHLKVLLSFIVSLLITFRGVFINFLFHFRDYSELPKKTVVKISGQLWEVEIVLAQIRRYNMVNDLIFIELCFNRVKWMAGVKGPFSAMNFH